MTAVYAIGSNGSGQLGIGHKEDVSVPKPVIFSDEQLSGVSQIKAGGNHTLILTSGTLFFSGDSLSGACGLAEAQTGSQFRQIQLGLEEITDIVFCAASWEASIIVARDEDGLVRRMYSFGTGNKGELGLGDFLFRSSKAQMITDFPPHGLEVVDLAASVSHVVAVLSNGDVYGWGNGRKGQLGSPDGIITAPRKIPADFKVVRAVCGREFTYLVGEKEAGEHAILGSDKWEVRSMAPANISGWKDIGATWGSILVLKKDGKLLSWGRGDHGQLAPSELPLLSEIAIGSEHALGLSHEGDVLAWGWGEHGNCGPNTTDGDVKGRWNIIASSKHLRPGTSISKIGAGCATSWVCLSG